MTPIDMIVSLVASLHRLLNPRDRTERLVRNLTQLARGITRHTSGRDSDFFGSFAQLFGAMWGRSEKPSEPPPARSLNDHSPFAEHFHRLVVDLTDVEAELRPALSDLGIEPQDLAKYNGYLDAIKSSDTTAEARLAARRGLDLFCASVILPALKQVGQGESPRGQPVLPVALFANVRGQIYIKWVRQANGTHENGWYDACAVVMRKLVESLIIHVFEAKNAASEIKDKNNHFLMLRDLIEKLRAKKEWNLGRNTDKALDKLKALGDLAAHARYYITHKEDIRPLIPELRIAVEELIHQAGLTTREVKPQGGGA